MTSLGASFARAIASKDRDAVRAVLATDVDFLGLTPRRTWEATDAEGVLGVLFDHWFEDQDVIEGVLHVGDGEPVEDTSSTTYRFAISTPDGPHVVEQHAYYRSGDDRIQYLRIICSGFRPRS